MSDLERTSSKPTESQEPEEGFSDDAQAQAAAARARAAMDEPLFPRAPRCPRCGERLRPIESAGDDGEQGAGASGPSWADACERCRAGTVTTLAGELLVTKGSRRRETLRGATFVLRGLLRLRSPALWKQAGILLAINVALGGALFFLFCYRAESVAGWLHTVGENAESKTGLGWVAGVAVRWGLAPAAKWLPYGVSPLVGVWFVLAVPFNILFKLALVPFMDKVTAATEAHVLDLGHEERRAADKMFAGHPWRVVVDALILSGAQAGLALVLLPLGFLPLVGGLTWLLVPPVMFAAVDYSSLHLTRRGYRLDEKVRLWRRHHWRFLGFGLAFTLLLAVPLVGALLLPAVAAGLALLFLSLDHK
jgi:uncharacterized protein involved in cysteine biosynthesis